jgi:hypothetical protein
MATLTQPDYLRARYFDPSTGQFVSRDPAVAMTRQPFAYVHGNPLNATDPTGLCDFWDVGCEARAAAAAAAGGVAAGVGLAHDYLAVPVAHFAPTVLVGMRRRGAFRGAHTATGRSLPQRGSDHRGLRLLQRTVWDRCLRPWNGRGGSYCKRQPLAQRDSFLGLTWSSVAAIGSPGSPQIQRDMTAVEGEAIQEWTSVNDNEIVGVQVRSGSRAQAS